MSENREQIPADLEGLIRLARRFAPARDRKFQRHGDEQFELWWRCAALTGAIASLFPNASDLLSKARAAEHDRSVLIELWRDVSRLPYATVEQMIDFVQRHHAIWDLEDYLNTSLEGER